MNDIDIEFFVKKRDMYINALTYSSPGISLEKDLLAAFNIEINMLQSIIENINNPRVIEDNPYFHSWIEDTIRFHKASRSPELEMFLRLKNYIGSVPS